MFDNLAPSPSVMSSDRLPFRRLPHLLRHNQPPTNDAIRIRESVPEEKQLILPILVERGRDLAQTGFQLLQLLRTLRDRQDLLDLATEGRLPRFTEEHLAFWIEMQKDPGEHQGEHLREDHFVPNRLEDRDGGCGAGREERWLVGVRFVEIFGDHHGIGYLLPCLAVHNSGCSVLLIPISTDGRGRRTDCLQRLLDVGKLDPFGVEWDAFVIEGKSAMRSSDPEGIRDRWFDRTHLALYGLGAHSLPGRDEGMSYSVMVMACE